MGQTLSQKILTAHALDGQTARPGVTLRLGVDWIMASELAMAGMQETFTRLGNPRLHAPERFFLAIDHTVDPHTILTDAKTRQLVRLSRDFARAQKIAAFYDANQTIMHTAFYRHHALPGSVVVGADSHTTSHGALGAFAIGLGGADVAVAAVTGQTWITVPEEVLVTYRGALPFGITGKDVVLRTLQAVGCNRHALERGVEFRCADGAELSVDARFTICNMTAEMGGVNGIFAVEPETYAFLTRFDRTGGTGLLAADPDADYAARFDIGLASLPPLVAKPFSPDNVFPVDAVAGQALDGCFIGACTTTEEELILAGLMLERQQAAGLAAAPSDRRLMIPGEVQIHRKLEAAGLLDAYRAAGFRIGVPGCHMCLGLGSERAGRGETWLSSQNRNFRNRMGAGSLAWLASGLTVAASAAGMQVADPRPWLDGIDRARLARLLDRGGVPGAIPAPPPPRAAHGPAAAAPAARIEGRIAGRALLFGDHVDTDAIIPGEFCSLTDPAELGRRAFHHVRPEMPELAGQGLDIIVAGQGWGCGSSREHAAWALKGAGVKLVIAKSLAVIHRRNLINEGIPALTAPDPAFFAAVAEGDALTVDLAACTVTHGPSGRSFPLAPLGAPEAAILSAGGLVAQVRAMLAEA